MKMIKFILAVILILTNNVYAQSGIKDSILVTVEIIAKGNPSICSDYYKDCDNNNYFARAAVINNTDSTVSFYMYNCSWEESWVSDNKNISFFI